MTGRPGTSAPCRPAAGPTADPDAPRAVPTGGPYRRMTGRSGRPKRRPEARCHGIFKEIRIEALGLGKF